MSYNIEMWGNTVWYLFHGIAHKIKDNEFNNVKDDIIFIIKTTCSCLPCPECSQDAMHKLQKVNFENIHSKQELKLLIFNFHNSINKKLNKPLFKEEDLDNKYENLNLTAISNNFNIIFSSNSNVPQLMSASFNRKHNLPKIMLALNNIMKYT